jgi:hypothetical protein
MSRHPEVKWAQRTDKIYITILLPDAKNADVELQPEGKLTFSATVGSQDTPFELNLELYDKVNVEASKINVGLRNIFCVVEKAEKGWWKRLLKGEGKTPLYLKVDWDKWVDEDEEDEKVGGDADFGGMGGMDLSGMGGGGMDFSGMGGGDEADSDDEDQEPPKEDSLEAKTLKIEPEDSNPESTVEVPAKV